MNQKSEISPAFGGQGNQKLKVLFLCVANSCRSQMAEGLTRHYLGEHFDAYSAGYMSTYVNPNAIKVMAEIGIDISGHRSKEVSEFHGQPFDIVITVCEEGDAACPVWLGEGNKVHLPFYDPVRASGTEEEVLAVFRRVRDEMKETLLVYLKDISNRECSVESYFNKLL
ncbi:MAG: arsenate reductase ArsC [Ignavibacteriae bacterium]|nr:arsenate reductase ArsC [Ignavibacteriota bacterium]